VPADTGEELHVQEEKQRFILFGLGAEWFALPIETVKEVQPFTRITRVPYAPAEILGIMNLRGKVLALYDLQACLGGPQHEVKEGDQVIVLDLDPNLVVGVIAERIEAVKEVPLASLEALSSSRSGPLEGLISIEGMAVSILDPRKLFASFFPSLQ